MCTNLLVFITVPRDRTNKKIETLFHLAAAEYVSLVIAENRLLTMYIVQIFIFTVIIFTLFDTDFSDTDLI